MAGRSDLERSVMDDLYEREVLFLYEPKDYKIRYYKEYQPDIVLPNNIHIEIKGWHKNFGQALSKLCSVKKQNPTKDIRIVWGNAGMLVPFKKKGKKMTAIEWSEKNGFLWAHQTIPQEWIDE